MVKLYLFLLALATGQTANFFLISDIHLDIAYEEDYASSCKCHSVGLNGRNVTIEQTQDWKPLGRFGCDSPLELLNSALYEMRAINSYPDYILVTGDVIGHSTYSLLQTNNIYNSTYTESLVRITFQQVTTAFQSYFPGVQVIFALGNNDGYGDYQLPTTNTALGLNEYLYELWKPLNPSLPADFVETGYYACDIETTGQRLLVLSTNYFSMNVENVRVSAINQLQWLREQLKLALSTHQRVLIAMHIPPGPGMYDGNSFDWHGEYIRLFEKIVKSYRNGIDLVIAAHQHQAGFQLIGESGLAVVIHTAISPIFGNNPGFRYYQIQEGKQDYTDYSLDLFTEQPSWEKEIVFSTFTGLEEFDYEEVYGQLRRNEGQLFQYLVMSRGLNRDVGTFISPAYVWSVLFDLKDESALRRVALCTYKYLSNILFDLCKLGLLPII